MNALSEPIDILFYGHCIYGEDGTPAPVGFVFASRDNRHPSRDRSEDSDTSDNNDNDDNMSVSNQPESSAAAEGELQTGARPTELERCTPAIRRMSTNPNQTLMLFPMLASHHLLVRKLLPILVTWTLVP